MLVIHIISTEDTNDFSGIYDGLDATILINPTTSECRRAIINETEKIVLIGHGTECGLLNQRIDGYIIDSRMVQFLRGKDVICIWCNASNFADRYDLTGFFTSMFISNTRELIVDFKHLIIVMMRLGDKIKFLHQELINCYLQIYQVENGRQFFLIV